MRNTARLERRRSFSLLLAASAALACACPRPGGPASAPGEAALAVPAAAPNPFGGRTDRAVLGSGLTLLTSEDRSLPMVTMQVLVKAGSRLDPAGKEGLANLMAEVLTLGTEKRSALQMSEALDSIGASFGASASEDTISLSLTYLEKDEDPVLEILADVLTHPTFPEDEIERKKKEVKGALKDREDDPEQVASEALTRELYGAGGYGHLVEGTTGALDAITRDDLVAFFGSQVRPNNAIVVAVGDLEAAAFRAKIETCLSGWAAAPIPEEAFRAEFPGGRKVVRIDRQVSQAKVLLGQEGVRRESPDYYALQVMNYILGGGGFSSRLTTEIRTKRGLVYDVASYWEARKLAGSFEVSLGTKNESANEAIAIVQKEIDRIRGEPVPPVELDAAKKYLTGSFPLRLDSNRKKTGFLASVEYYGLGLDYPEKYKREILAVTPDDILRVARQYLHPEKTVLVVVADQGKAQIPEQQASPEPTK